MRTSHKQLLMGFALIPVAALVLHVLFKPETSETDELRPDPDTHRVTELGADGCPAGMSEGGLGPEMARMPEGFCIDTTEVSRAQYEAWLETTPDASGQTGACAANDDFTPSCQWPPGGADPAYPVVCVDWCDANAFCEAAGKRLCGGVGDGAEYPFESYADAAVSEWQAACTSGGLYDYPYGNDLDTTICRGADAEDHTTWGYLDVGSSEGCHSPEAGYAAVYDMSGNAAEWDNSCEGDGAEDGCRIRGGSFEHNEHGLRCAMGARLAWPRTRQVPAVGFRCCAD